MASPNTHINVAGTWKKVNKMYVKVSGSWKQVNNAYVKVAGVWKEVYKSQINITISANQTNLNLFSYAGSPSTACTYVVTINSGVVISSDNTGTPALSTGTFPVGSTLRIINNGSIIGMGGAGSDGTRSGSDALQAENGGPSMSLGMNVTIENGSGLIAGGGGGGGGGGGAWKSGYYGYGGGGGGGRSSNFNSAYGLYCTAANGPASQNGVSGTITSAGGGGSGSSQGTTYGGNGGAGGNYGASGTTGGNGTGGTTNRLGGAGGAGGKAINLNGYSVTWVSGNDSTHVKGSVS